MGNEISTATTAVKPFASNTFKKSRKCNENSFTICSLPTEILFEILAFVKFHEAPNIFLVNRYFLQICQVYFHSGNVGSNKVRNVRDLTMELKEDLLTIFVKRNGTLQSVPVPEVDPPKIFNAFGDIIVGKCCRIQAMQFLYKFPSLLTMNNNQIICWRNFLLYNTNADDENEKQFFFNWIGQKKLWLVLKSDYSSNCKGVARCLANESLIARFNGCLCMEFKNERALCGLKKDAKLIYGWISSAETRQLEIYHYDAQKTLELACQIALLFKEAHINKTEAEKMNLKIFLLNNTVVPMHVQKVCNGIGNQLATLRTFLSKYKNEIYMTYVFYTNPLDYYYENKKELELVYRKEVDFLFFKF